MKKITALFLTVICVFSLCFCSDKEPKVPAADSGTDSGDAVTNAPSGDIGVSSVDDISLENLAYLFMDMTDLGLASSCTVTPDASAATVIGNDEFDLSYEEGISIDPMMFPNTFTLGIFRVANGGDAKNFASELEKKANRQKWVCVGADIAEAEVSGRTVLFIMADRNRADKILDCFENICADGFVPEEHIKRPLADITMQELYESLLASYGRDNYGFLDNEGVTEFSNELGFGFGGIDTSIFVDSVFDTGYQPQSDESMEGSYILAAFRISEGKDSEAFAGDLLNCFSANALKGHPQYACVALGENAVLFFAGYGGNSYYSYDIENLIKNQYRMKIVGVHYSDETQD